MLILSIWCPYKKTAILEIEKSSKFTEGFKQGLLFRSITKFLIYQLWNLDVSEGIMIGLQVYKILSGKYDTI